MTSTTSSFGRRPRGRRVLIGFGGFLALVAILIVFWDWNWLKPLVEHQASSALGRKVTIGNFDVRLGLHPVVIGDRIAIGNPKGFPENSRLGAIGRLAVTIDLAGLLHHSLDLTSIEIADAQGDLQPGPDGRPNWLIPIANPDHPSPSPMTLRLGQLTIKDGVFHVVNPALKADFVVTVKTQGERGGATGKEPDLVITAKGTYKAQPITARFVGGSVLSLRESDSPYPVFLDAANGATRVLLRGTVQDPLHLAGARLKLDLHGASLADLYGLTGIPFPATAPYHLTGNLDYVPPKFRFSDFIGTVGSSDLSGELAEAPGKPRPLVTGTLHSKRVVMADLGGFIGAVPGKTEVLTPAQRAQKAKVEASPKFLPDQPINVPKLASADIDVTYRADRIEGKAMPLDNIVARLMIRDGDITLDPLNFAVGTGAITSTVSLAPRQAGLHAVTDVDFRSVDFRRVMSSTGLFHGAGVIGGRAHLDGTGRSFSEIVGNGDGSLRLFMLGGNISALLVDLAGLEFGSSVLSAIGVPKDTNLRCMVTDFGLTQGLLKSRLMLVDTGEANVVGSGDANLKGETLNFQIITQPKHFSIGSLPTPIDIGGTFKSPTFRPDPKALSVRGGMAAVLGVLLTPLGALLPTIQLGLGKDNDCVALVHQVKVKAQTGTK